jgi:hypothetical protein
MDAILKTQAEKLARETATRVGPLDDLNGLMRTMMKTALQRMLYTEVVHVRGENGRVSRRTMYVALDVNLQGKKELWDGG